MCGIVGFVGKVACSDFLVDALKKLEYRGYDSAGIAVFEGDRIKTVKAKGKIAEGLSPKLKAEKKLNATCGIGHTRWATHGEPSDVNAHPIGNGRVCIVHNGIIENYREIKAFLTGKGYGFESETDTETVAKLLDYYYNGDPVKAIEKAVEDIEGAYSLGIIFREHKNVIYAVRKDSTLIVGKGDGESYIASDVTAILEHTRDYYCLERGEIAVLDESGIRFTDMHGEPIEKELLTATWDVASAQKGGYEHFMMKEIQEQPRAVHDTIHSYVKDGGIDLGSVGLTDEDIRKISRLYMVACGSAYHVGMAAKYIFEDLAGIPVEVDLASEFRYRNPILEKDSLVVIISQSGETADSLAALREAKSRGVRTLAVVNVVGSSIPREADNVFYTMAGPEIAVATTKAYSTQLIASYLLAIRFAYVRGKLEEEGYTRMVQELMTLPEKIRRVLEDKERIQWFSSKFANVRDIFFIGRGLDYAISLEGSLKMKEISYVHSEAYAAGELKHGTISLVEDGTLVVGVLTQAPLFEKMVSNLVEVKSRGAYLMGLTNYGNYAIEDTVDFTVYVPKTDPHFTTSLAIIPLQLMGYYVSCAKGLDVDKPRNLAKSVTVE